MGGPRYLPRRIGRSQNGIGAGFSAAGGAAFDSPERTVPSLPNHPLPPAAGRGGDPARACCRTGGCAGPRALVPAPEPLREPLPATPPPRLPLPAPEPLPETPPPRLPLPAGP